MPQTSQSYNTTEDEFVDSIDDGDYIFIMDQNGNLKSLLLPDDALMNVTPDKVQQVLSIFGLTEFSHTTLH